MISAEEARRTGEKKVHDSIISRIDAKIKDAIGFGETFCVVLADIGVTDSIVQEYADAGYDIEKFFVNSKLYKVIISWEKGCKGRISNTYRKGIFLNGSLIGLLPQTK